RRRLVTDQGRELPADAKAEQRLRLAAAAYPLTLKPQATMVAEHAVKSLAMSARRSGVTEEKTKKTAKSETGKKEKERKEEKETPKAKSGVFCQQCENRNTKTEKSSGPGSRGWCKVHNKNVRRKEDASRCPDFKKKRQAAATKRLAVVEEEEKKEAEAPDVICADCAFVGRSERDSKGDDLGFYCEKRGAFMAGAKIPHKCEFFRASERAARGRKKEEGERREAAAAEAAETSPPKS
ncbi:MAG: hypothetical protein N3A66_09510, partial [Planctomycetota bacterium]|nr:hypothetical protein [Planctomycetota bacterium]